jgi:hypothetical protein
LVLNVIVNAFGFFMISVAFTNRFGKVLSGLQPTFELQYGGTTNLTSVKTTRKLVSVASEVRMIVLVTHNIFPKRKTNFFPFLYT